MDEKFGILVDEGRGVSYVVSALTGKTKFSGTREECYQWVSENGNIRISRWSITKE